MPRSPSSLFVPPPPGDQLRQGLDQWERWTHAEDVPLLVRIAVGHYQFETLHPFIDGNGRVGRLGRSFSCSRARSSATRS